MAKKSETQGESPQENFRLGPELTAAFRQWCAHNGYDKKAVFKAGLKLLTDMGHDARMAVFRDVPAWEDEFIRGQELAADVAGAAEEATEHEGGGQARKPRPRRRA